MADGIPTALQAQMDELQAALKGEGATAGEGQPQPPAPAEAAPKTQPGQRQASEPKPAEQPLVEGAQKLGKTGQAPQGEEADWQHKYSVINGKYLHETGRLREELQKVKEELEALRRQPPQPAAVPAQPQPAPATTDPRQSATEVRDDEVTRLVKPDLIQEFGMDYWKQQIVLQRAIQASQTSQTRTQAESPDRIAEVEHRLDDQSRRAFYGELSTLVPDWEQTNGSKEWDEFLGQVEPLTGMTYEALLKDAYDRYDSVRVSNLFQRFGGGRQPERKGPAIESQVMPATRKAPETVNPAGPTMAFEDWNRQMQELTSGGMSPMQAVEKKKQLMDAWTQKRVTGIPDGGGAPGPSFV